MTVLLISSNIIILMVGLFIFILAFQVINFLLNECTRPKQCDSIGRMRHFRDHPHFTLQEKPSVQLPHTLNGQGLNESVWSRVPATLRWQLQWNHFYFALIH